MSPEQVRGQRTRRAHRPVLVRRCPLRNGHRHSAFSRRYHGNGFRLDSQPTFPDPVRLNPDLPPDLERHHRQGARERSRSALPARCRHAHRPEASKRDSESGRHPISDKSGPAALEKEGSSQSPAGHRAALMGAPDPSHAASIRRSAEAVSGNKGRLLPRRVWCCSLMPPRMAPIVFTRVRMLPSPGSDHSDQPLAQACQQRPDFARWTRRGLYLVR